MGLGVGLGIGVNLGTGAGIKVGIFIKAVYRHQAKAAVLYKVLHNQGITVIKVIF